MGAWLEEWFLEKNDKPASEGGWPGIMAAVDAAVVAGQHAEPSKTRAAIMQHCYNHWMAWATKDKKRKTGL